MDVLREGGRAALAWLGEARKPYLVLVLSILAVTASAGRRNWWFVAVSLVVMFYASYRLHECVRTSRVAGDEHRRGRVVLGIVQVLFGTALVGFGASLLGTGAAWFFFFGVTLVLLATGTLLSEWRRAQGERHAWTTRVLFAVAIGLLLAALLLPAQWVAIGFALIMVELATELVSERAHKSLAAVSARVAPASHADHQKGERRRLNRRAMAYSVIGVVTVALGFVLLLTRDVTGGHAAVVLGVVLLFVLLAAADSDSLWLVLLTGCLLAWAAAPRNAELPEGKQALAHEPYFLVLGDSYISGEGSERFLPGTNTTATDDTLGRTRENECRRSPTAWPVLLAGADLPGVPERVLFLACSGAVTENIHTAPREDDNGEMHGPAELELFRERSRELPPPAFVVVTVGGNDAGFGEIGRTCVGPGDCTEVGQQFLKDPRRRDDPQPVTGAPGAGMAESLAHIKDDLDAAYTRITSVVPDVPVVAVAYPIPITPGGECGVLLGKQERDFVIGFVTELNRVVEAAASRHGFLFLDGMESALVNADALLCAESGAEAGLNFIKLNPKAGSIRDSLMPTNWVHNSLHPNDGGHRAMATAAVEWFRTNLPLDPPAPDPAASYAVQSVDRIMGREVPQCGTSFACGISDQQWLVAQTHDLYRRALVPVAVLAIGGWYALMPLLVYLRIRHIDVGWIFQWVHR